METEIRPESRRYASDKPVSCKYCYFWGGRKKGCELKECYYLLPEEEPEEPTTPTDPYEQQKAECTAQGGTWNDTTNTCTPPPTEGDGGTTTP